MSKIVIFILSLYFLQCSYIFEPNINEASSVEIFEDTWQIADNNYPFFTFKNIDWDALHEKYYSKVQQVREDEILVLIHDLLGELKDGHVWFYTRGGKRIRPFVLPRVLKDQKAFSLLVVQQYFNEPLSFAGNKRFYYGILSGNIGYIYISTFERNHTKWYFDFKDIIVKLRNTRGVILDVRQNGGGSDIVTNYIVSFFLNQSMESPLWIDARGDTLSRHWINPNEGIHYFKPTVILQNGGCFSAAEGFINIIKELPQVTTVGDTTAGGGGAPEDFNIAGGFTIRISTKAQLGYNGEHIEWNGIPPDILIRQTEQDVKKDVDHQLEFAIQLLNNS
ncbi:MAG: hypothetical protein GXO77_12370 [Calditrichaeota bacterium]|nr:hypothetical protein [Calditrichota bacterium]